MKKSLRYFLLSAFSLAVLINVLAWKSAAFCDFYVSRIFPIWLNTYGKWTSRFPFSVGEIMIVTAVVLLCIFVRSFFCFIKRNRRKSNVGQQRQNISGFVSKERSEIIIPFSCVC